MLQVTRGAPAIKRRLLATTMMLLVLCFGLASAQVVSTESAGLREFFSNETFMDQCDSHGQDCSVSLLQTYSAGAAVRAEHKAKAGIYGSYCLSRIHKAFQQVLTHMAKKRSTLQRPKWTNASKDLCGSRPLFPHLQFDLEVFQRFGLVDGRYAECRMPKVLDIDLSYHVKYRLREAKPEKSEMELILQRKEHRSRITNGLISFFLLSGALLVAYSMLTMLSAKLAGKPNAGDLQMLRMAMRRGAFDWTGGTLAWLEPVIGRFGWPNSAQIETSELDARHEVPSELYVALDRAWEHEVQVRGHANADLLRAMNALVGFKVMAWMIVTMSVATALEVTAMTMGLDIVLNLLQPARSLPNWDRFVSSAGTAELVSIFMVMAFVAPMLARAFHTMASLKDTHYTNQVVSALLTLLHKKSQRLACSTGFDWKEVQNIQLLTKDIRNAWSGALIRRAHSIISPACVILLMIFLIKRVGRAARFGVVGTISLLLLFVPIQHYWNEDDQHIRQSGISRLSLLKDTILNVHAVKAANWDQPLADRMKACRDKEVKIKFHAKMVQTFLDIPISMFPYLLVISTLLSLYFINELVTPGEIFACMEVLAGLVRFSPSLSDAMKSSIQMSKTAKRVQHFLEKPEKSNGCKSQALPGPDAPVEAGPSEAVQTSTETSQALVKVRGSFSMPGALSPVLHNLDLEVRPGELVAIVGEVASGKSALLSAIRGNMSGFNDSSLIQAPDDLTFCPQELSVMDGSLEDNVANGEPDDPERFYEALDTTFQLTGWPEINETEKLRDFLAAEQAGVQEDTELQYPFPYLELLRACSILVLIISVANINWNKTPIGLGIFIAVIQGFLNYAAVELPIKALVTLMTNRQAPKQAECENTTVILNYNLLAICEADVDKCMQNMLEAYTNNLSENVSAVLISATDDPTLQEYEEQVRDGHRALLYTQLFRSGLCWAGFSDGEEPNHAWQKQVWEKYAYLDKAEFVENHLHNICRRYTTEYMVLHRTSRVLRKCGQYQDLILLSDGEDKVFTYCDVGRYGGAARQEGEPLFKPSADAANMFNRKFEYTLVLDSDTRVERGAVKKLLSVAVAHPDKAIVQPAIKMYCGPKDPIFMHLEVMRQRIYEPMYDSVANAIGKSSFFGKGLIKNSLYKDACLGSRGHLVESVPIDVLSHDTFEAAVSEVMYCNSVHLLEAPPQTYITWDIRERRWNLGEFILAGYFWPNFVGRPMHWLQSWIQGKKLFRKQCRCRPQMDGAKAYLAHAAMRQMIMKPCLLLYVILMHFAELHWRLLPFFTVLFMVLVAPKFAVMRRSNCREVLLETWASIMQFTPEAVVGTIRVMSALLAHLVGKVSWTPQRSVEEESKASNPFLFSMRYLWYYSVLAFFWTLRVISLWWPNVGNEAIFIVSILGTLFMLPAYAGFTSLRADTFGWLFFEQNSSEERASGLQHIFDNTGSLGASQKEANASETVVDADLVAKVNALTQMELEKQLGKLAWKPATAKACGVRNSCLSQVDRAGVAIARAAYSTSKLVLLDDPFAAVDAGIGKHFLEKVICGPLMQNRTRVVSMLPKSSNLQRFDKVVVLSKGRIVAQGSPQEVMAMREFQELMPTQARQSPVVPISNSAASQWNAESYLRQPDEVRSVPRPVESTKAQTTPFESIGAFLEGESLNFETTFDFMDETQRPLQLSTLRDLIQDGGFGWLSLAVMCLLLFRLCMQGVMILLGRWADQAHDENQTSVINLICILNLVFVAYLCHIAQGYALSNFSTNASRKLFQRAFVSVLQAPIDGFWNLKSASRIHGLLSTAMLNVEHALAGGSFAVAGVAADIAIQQTFCLFIMPMWVKIPTYVMVCSLCSFCGNATWHLQLLSHMALTKWQEEQVHLKSRNHSQEHQKKLAGQLCGYAGLFAMPDSLCSYVRTWTVSRISFCLCFQCTLCILIAIWRPDRITIDALIMVITSTFYILMQLEPLVASMGKAVSAGISVQQLADYSTVPQDAPELMQGDESRRLNFLMDGIAVRFEGVSASYGVHGRDVLANVSFTITRKSKTLLAGPPGSGKSTALNCITRMLGLKQGKVVMNDTDIKQVGMMALRRLVLLVPQEPVVFQGTVRFNIDPLNQFPDEQVWKAAKAAQLCFMRDNELKHMIEDGGSNLSRGQKVLINYARAVCQQPALLLLDDCLSALDVRKQEVIRDDIMASFNNSTIIAAACDLANFAVFDHLVVLEKGSVMREGPMRDFL
mmetsp:Transcript_104449/g.184982  ORF Transcript_104449/g.184982 Transcript_104449/m.184982 type:complete len:2227 (-) Transcript_104449:48-6728(-)